MLEKLRFKPRVFLRTATLLPLTFMVSVLLSFVMSDTEQKSLAQAETLGTVHFEVSCSDAIAKDFDAALALLHHMQYEESRAAFEQITIAESDCGMAHWGIAMTLFQPLWPSRPGPEMLQRGWDEVKKAQTLGVKTNREANLVAATAAFFSEPESATWWTRIQRWSQAMKQAYTARPDDTETAAFYALSQLAVGQTQPDRMAYHDRAATVLTDIYKREPQHPGAIHYTIHTNDIDSRARESLEIVRSYGLIAPEVPHALHMPTHIFVRLGFLSEVIEWNLKSANAALKHPAASGISHHYPHALDYSVYAYLQRGEDSQAHTLIEEVLQQERG